MTPITTRRRPASPPGDPALLCFHAPEVLVLVALVRDVDLDSLVVADALDVAQGAAVASHALLCLVCGDVEPQQGVQP